LDDNPMNPLPDNHPATDDALLDALAAGNPAALARLMERHGGLVLNVARGILRDHHAAEDVAQAVFLALARKARRLRGTGTVAPWLYRVTHDLAVNAVRQQERRRRREQEAVAMPSLAEPPRESLTPEQHQQLHAQLRCLPERYRAPLVLCYLEGQPGEQAAQALGLHPAALRKRLERGRDRLRRRLTRLGWSAGAAGAVTALLTAEAGAAPVPAALIAATTSAAAGGSVSATVAGLTQGALHMIFWNNVKTVSLAAAIGLAATGTGVVVAQRAAPARVEGPPPGGAVTASPSTPPKGGTPTTPVPAGKMSAAETCAGPWLRRAAREVTGISSNAPQMWVWGDIAQQWARLGNMAEFNAALRNLEQLEAGAGKKPYWADSYRFGGIVRLIPPLVRNGQVAEATKLCDDLPAAQQAGAKQTLAQALAQAGRLAEARAVADSLAGKAADNVKIGIATGLANAGLTADALEAAQSLPQPFQNNVYMTLVLAQAKNGDYAAAKQTIQTVPAEARESAWVWLFRQQLQRGDFAAAKESLLAMPSAQRRESTYFGYCSGLVRNGRLEEAKATALEMVGQPQELSAFNAVCEELIKRGDEAGAAAFREQISPKLRDQAAKDYRYLLVKAAADAGDAQRAARHLEAMPAAERSVSAYLNEAAALAQAAPDGGKRWAMPTVDRSVSPYLRVAIALAKAQDTDGSRRYLELAKTADPKMPLGRFYGPLAAEMAKAGNIEAALQLAQELPENQGRAGVLGDVAKGCTVAGQFERALAIVQGMPAGPERIWTARTLASSAALKGRWADLPGWVDALPGAHDRAQACLAVSDTCFTQMADPVAVAQPIFAGDLTKVFKSIDTTQSGFYADGLWSYAYEPRQGTLKYDGREVGSPQPGDFILTPWGWMQWQEKGHWLPVAEKPATGKQLPDPGKK
jgi:RNA polymerase sigma factor (sigma-70 family)